MGKELSFAPTKDELHSFGESVPNWPAFPDSAKALARLKRLFQLAVITNCDDAFFAASNKKLGVEFDHVISAQQVGKYKPSLDNFHVALKPIGRPATEILHVAQSLFHDHVPARQVGLSSAWINRRHSKPGFGATLPAHAKPDYEFPDMKSFADAAGAPVVETSSP